MKKLFTTAFLMLFAMPAIAGQIIVSDEHPGEITNLPISDNYEAAKITVELDTTSTILITSGGFWNVTMSSNSINIDNNPITITTMYEFCNRSYLTTLQKGIHTIKLLGITRPGDYKLLNIYLQVLIFTPDEVQAVMETPNTNDPIKPKSILATGVSVHIDGCNSVYNISGQKVVCQITNGEVMVNSLSEGTYFAKGNNGGVTKIVKVN